MNGRIRVRHFHADAGAPPVRRFTAFVFEEKTPPDEIQLWDVGENPTDYGVHVWSERSAEMVMAWYEKRGNPLPIDVEHNAALDAEGEPGLSGGYAALEIRNGAPWLRFEWSEFAAQQIATAQRLFLSPEYDVDSKTNEIVGLYRVSLVANPGTHRARMLASAAPQTGENKMDQAMFIAALEAALTAEDPKAAIEALLAKVKELSGDPDAPPAADATDPVADPAAAAAADDKTAPPGTNPPADDKTKATAPVAAKASAPTAPVRTDESASKAVLAVKAASDIARDMLLEKHGERLPTSIRAWAATQSYSVVRGLVDAAPAKVEPPARVKATQGNRTVVGEGLEGEELADMRRELGIMPKVETFKASRNDRGTGVEFSTMTPTQIRAAAAAKKGAEK